MKPWQYWLAFVVCLAVVFAAMGWVSLTAVRLDRSQMLARREAAFEENVRLSLWRMDSALAPILARESSRPYFVYSPFYPEERAYTKMFEEITESEVMVPSPLLRDVTPRVLLHFQIDPQGQWMSPQVPRGRMKNLAVQAYDNGGIIEESESRLAGLRKDLLMEEVTREKLLEAIPENPDAGQQTAAFVLAQRDKVQAVDVSAQPTPTKDVQNQKSISEWNARNYQLQAVRSKGTKPGKGGYVSKSEPQQTVQQMSQQNQESLMNEDLEPVTNIVSMQLMESQARSFDSVMNTLTSVTNSLEPLENISGPRQAVAAAASDVTEGVMHPLWIGSDVLLLARRVTVKGDEYVQGCWLDWPEIKRELLVQIGDLLDQPDLVPAVGVAERAGGRRLAGLPVRLVPGEMSRVPFYGLTPVRLSLYVAWACVLLAAMAVGILLVGAVSLSERRGAFVSAVTHELRTPLTTFRIYSEMLAEGMVTDDSKRKDYLNTLCAEGNRLSHLVENVLSYARLERGHGRGQVETVGLADMIDRMKDRLSRRAEQCGMTLVADDEKGMPDVKIKADVSAVEQILFNLVDNACKYAGSAGDKRIHIGGEVSNQEVLIRVRDHGFGIAREESGRLFRPFCKSAKHAAESAPGVGLGLALSRRLARQMGGDLRIDGAVKHGACFELVVPAADNDGMTQE